MRFVSFASSSKGNSALISYKDTNILVDCGISRKRLIENLSRYELTLDDIDSIVITHSHTDHIGGLASILKYNDIKIVGLKETLSEVADLLEKNNISANYDNFKIIRPINPLNDDVYIKIKDINVYPLKGCHDVPSLYYKFDVGERKIAILTDMGAYNDSVIRNLSNVNYLMLECNYDEILLKESKRPESLKLRIAGSGGHLSNRECCEIISRLDHNVLKKVYLSHISEETNSEEYALKYVLNYFKINNSDIDLSDKIFVTRRIDYTEIVNDEL